MAYESGDDLYILRGYGKQKSGGFSIQIEEVSKSENAVFVRTKLVGPAAKEEQERHRLLPLRRARKRKRRRESQSYLRIRVGGALWIL